jgi:hypothetical protein
MKAIRSASFLISLHSTSRTVSPLFLSASSKLLTAVTAPVAQAQRQHRVRGSPGSSGHHPRTRPSIFPLGPLAPKRGSPNKLGTSQAEKARHRHSRRHRYLRPQRRSSADFSRSDMIRIARSAKERLWSADQDNRRFANPMPRNESLLSFPPWPEPPSCAHTTGGQVRALGPHHNVTL